MESMRTIADIRHDRLLELIGEAGGVQPLADKLGKPYSQISQVKNRATYNSQGARRAVGTKLAREMEHAMGKPEGWMDSDTKVCCASGEPADYREQADMPLAQSESFKQAVWRGAAMRLVEFCNAKRMLLDPETFADVVDAAVEVAGEDAAAAEKVMKAMLPRMARGREISHIPA
jgi:hypothetical protein